MARERVQPAKARVQEQKPGTANSTAERAFEALMVFSDKQPDWSASELATHFSMPRSTMYRYLNTLRGFGLIAEDEQGRYRLGPRILLLGRVARRNSSILQIALPYMHELSELFNESIILNEKVGHEMMTIEHLESRQRVAIARVGGQLLPWPAAASAKVLLAFADAREQNELLGLMTPVKYTANTIPSHALLRRALKQIREEGYAVGRGELDAEVRGIAAPVYWRSKCRFALSLAAPTYRLTEVLQSEIVAAVRDAANAITQQLQID
jgi:DNA-binding IclR family transcriptional regulator